MIKAWNTPSSSMSAGRILCRRIAFSSIIGLVVFSAEADDSHPTYYAQWGGNGKTNVCIHYVTPPGINPWYEGSIEFPTRVDGAIGTPNYSLPIVCGGDGAAGQNANEGEARASTGGYAGYQPLSINTTLWNQRDNVKDQQTTSPPPIIQDALVYISMGGWGGGGGDSSGGYSASTGGTGAKGGDLNVTFSPGQYSSINTATPSGWSSTIFLQSIGGSGGDGGHGGGNGGIAGGGGSVVFTNSVNITTNSYGIYAQSLGGWGGNGTNGSGSWWTGSNGGTGSAGGTGGAVFVKNNANIFSNYSIPIFAQSIGGNGGNGGNGSAAWYGAGGSGGAGGYGGPGGAVWVANTGNLYGAMQGGYGIFAQSVGGGGGNAGSSAGLYAIGASGGFAASGSGVIVANTAIVVASGSSSVGIFAQSIGGGGGAGGMAAGQVTVGGSGGEGGSGNAVNVSNTGEIYTGNACQGVDASGICLGHTTTAYSGASNGGAFGILAQSVGGGGGAGGMGISGSIVGGGMALGGTGGNGGNGGVVYVANSGYIFTRESNSAGILAQSIGGGGGSGGGAISVSASFIGAFGDATGGNGGSGGKGDAVGINCPNTTTDICSASGVVQRMAPVSGASIVTAGVGSPGILAQSIGGGGGNGGFAIALSASADASVSMAYGGAGATGGNAGGVYASPNGVAIMTTGSDSPGVQLASIGGGGGNGGSAVSGAVSGIGTFSVAMGGGGGAGGAGKQVFLDNTNATVQGVYVPASSITTSGDRSFGLIAQSIGGGGGSGGSSISAALSRGASVSQSIGGSGGNGQVADQVNLYNDGTIKTSGSAASAIVAQSIGGGGGNGGTSLGISASMWTFGMSVGGSGGGGGDGKTTTLVNNGNLTTTGGGAPVILAQSIGGGGGNGGVSGSGGFYLYGKNTSIGGTGGSGAAGGSVNVTNYGAITANNSTATANTGGNNSGILAQSIGGGGGNGGYSYGYVEAIANTSMFIGGTGGAAGTGLDVTVTNAGSLNIQGANSAGILAQSIGGTGGNGGTAVTGALSGGAGFSTSIGGGGANGAYARDVTLTSTGQITTNGSLSPGVALQSIGGSGGNGGLAVAGGISLGGNLNGGLGGGGAWGGDAGNVTANVNWGVATTGDQSPAILAQSIGGSGGNGGNAIAGSISTALSGTYTIGGKGGGGGNSEKVTVNLNADNAQGSSYKLSTNGLLSPVIVAQSIGGAGGNGGLSLAVTGSASVTGSVTIGGEGANGGHSGPVDVNTAFYVSLTTEQSQSPAIMAQSIGGTGGNGGLAGGAAASSWGAGLNIGGEGGTGGEASTVTIRNNSRIKTNALLSPGILAQSIGGTGGNGGYSIGQGIYTSGGVTVNLGGDGGKGGKSATVVVLNTNSILTLDSQSSGIIAQSIGGSGGNGGLAAGGGISQSVSLALNVGGSGGAGGQAYDVHVDNTGLISTNGNNSYGILAQSIGGSGGNGGNAIGWSVGGNTAISAAIGGEAGTGNQASEVTVVNAKAVSTHGDQSAAIVAQSIGGTGGNGGNAITGSFSSEASGAASVGGLGGNGGTAGDVKALLKSDGSGNLFSVSTTGQLSPAVLLQSIGGSGGNGGFSLSGSGSLGSSASVSIGGKGGNGGEARFVDFTTYGGAKIETSGNQSAGIVAQSIGGNGGNGGTALSGGASGSFSASVAVGGGGGSGGKSDSVDVNLYNSEKGIPYSVVTDGLMSPGIIAQSISGQGGNGGSSINGSIGGKSSLSVSISGYGGDADSHTGEVTVRTQSQASITTMQDQSAAILAQSIGGSGGNGGLAISGTASIEGSTASLSLGGSGGTGGAANSVTVNSESELRTFGAMSSGIIAQSIGGGGGNGGSTFVASSATSKTEGAVISLGVGGKGGVGGLGGLVTVSQVGDITTGGCDTAKTACDQSSGIIAQSIGGGGNGGSAFAFALQGLQSVNLNVGGSGGGGGDGNVVNVFSNENTTSGTIKTTGALSNAIFAQSIGGGGGSGGFATSVTVAASSPKSQALEIASAIGGSGGRGGNSSDVIVSTGGTLITSGNQSAAIYAQSVGGGGGSGGSSFSYFSSGTSTASKVAGLAASYGAGKMGISSGEGESSSASAIPSPTDLAPSLSKSSSEGTAIAISLGGAGGNGGSSGKVTLNSTSDISTIGDSSQGVFAQSVGGGGGSGGSSSSMSGSGKYVISGSLGGFGGTGGSSGDVSVATGDAKNINTSLIVTTGLNAAAIYAQSVGGGGGSGGSTSSTSSSSGYAIALGMGGIGGSGNSGGKVTVENSAQLITASANSAGIYAQSIGGGGGDGGTSSVSATKQLPPVSEFVPPSIKSYVGKLSSKTEGTASSDGGSSAAAGAGEEQKGSQAGGSSKDTAIGLSLGGFGGTGGNSGSVSVTNSAGIATGTVITAVNQTHSTLSSASGPTGLTNVADYSYAIFAQSIGGGGGSGGQSASDADTEKLSVALSIGGAGAGGGSGNRVDVTNTGSLTTNGAQASAIFAQSIGGGGGVGGDAHSVSNYFSTKSFALGLGGSGKDGGSGGDVTVNSSIGNIVTNGLASDGIYAQSVGGGGGKGGSSSTAVEVTVADVEGFVASGISSAEPGEASSETTGGIAVAAGLGGAGGSGGNGGNVSVSNSSQITTAGDSSSGIFAQSIGGGGGSAGSNTNHISMVSYSFNASLGGSGVAGNGGNVFVSSRADVFTSGQSAFGIFAQSVGGGGGIMNVVNTTTSATSGNADITANLGVNGGSNLFGGTVTLGKIDDPLIDWITTKGAGSIGVFAQSIGGGGGVALSNNASSGNGSVSAVAALGAVKGTSGASTGGNANAVQIFSNASISTAGNNAPAMVAQSIGGGGGLVAFNNASAQIKSLNETYLMGAQNGSSGNGGTVSVTQGGKSILTQGANSIGIVSQSISGGGGLILSHNTSTGTSNEVATENIVIGGSGSGSSSSSTVNMLVDSTIQTGTAGVDGAVSIGANSIGIAAQSVGGGGGITTSSSSVGKLSIANLQIGGQSGVGGDGAAVFVAQKGGITTQGPAAIGILAQSVGGGGGYAALAALQANATILNTANVNIGGSGSASGNGGDVKVDVSAPISTNGTNSVGVLAQSVGGGGGVLLTSGLNGSVTPAFSGGSGSGGNVTVNVNAPITVSGSGSIGVIAQSVGGGGGIYVNENGYLAKSGGGTGTAGSVSVYVNGVIQANTGTGIYAGAAKGANDPNITINKGAAVLATTGTAIAVDGLLNNIHNEGTIAVANSRNGIALDVKGSDGTTDIYNKGLISGALTNAGSNINVLNDKDGRFYLPNMPNLGKGVFTNAGYLMFNPLGEVATANTNHAGSFIQTSTGVLGIRLDFAAGKSDVLDISNSTQFVLDGKIRPVLLNTGGIKPGSMTSTLITSGAVNGLADISNNLGVDAQSAIMSYALMKTANSVMMSLTANFTPTGLSQFGSQVGQAIGQYQSAGSDVFFQTATAMLVAQPNVPSLDQAYQGLAGTSVQAVPQVMYQAVSQGISSYTDRVNDWRVSTSTSKSSRMAAFNQPKRYAMGKTGNSLVDAANNDGIIGGGRSGPWVSLFQSNVFSKSLTDRIFGGTIAYELENDRRDIMGGLGVTLSQSGYSYNSAPTPITPGNTTNVGLSFYGVGRGEQAYITGTGYLGGGNTNFTRQLQTMNFNSNTNVNIMSYVAAARVEAGYDFEPFRRENSNMKVTPFVAVQPTYIHQKGAQENFGSLGPGFNYSATDNTAVPVFAGLELSGNHMTEGGTKISPFIRASWMAETQKNGQMGANFNGNQGVNVFFNGSPNLGNAMMYKVGSVFGGERMSGYFTLDYDYGNASYSYRNYGVTGGIKYAF